jgi:hypothetical protein
MSDTNKAAAAAVPAASTLFTLPIHFKRWAEGSKGHQDLLALKAQGVIADFDKEVEAITEDGKKAFKRKTLSYSVTTLDCAVALAGSGLDLSQIMHIQELVNAAIKKDVQSMVADSERKSPVNQDDLPTWITTLSQSFNKRPTAIKITVEMLNAALAALEAYLVDGGVKEGGITLTKDLCTKKFSLASLNVLTIPVIEKVQGLIIGWYETLTEAEQTQHFAVVNLWDSNISAKLNPQQELISVDLF